MKNLSWKQKTIYIIIFIILVTLPVLLSYTGKKKKITDPLSFVAKDAQIVININIKSGIKKYLFSHEYENLQKDPNSSKNLDFIGDKLMLALFFKEPKGGINITKDFLQFVSPDISIAYFNLEGLLYKFPIKTKKSEIKPVTNSGIFRVLNKEKVEDFFKQIKTAYGGEEKVFEGYKIFISRDFSYAFVEDFLILASNQETLSLSLETIKGTRKSILSSEKFQLYTKKTSLDTIGFIYFNLDCIRENVYRIMDLPEDSFLAQFLDSFKLIGTSISVSSDGISLETLILPEENLENPIVKNFFSQVAKKPVSLNFFSRKNTTNILLLSNMEEILSILTEILPEISPDLNKKLFSLVESRLKLNMERDILGSLTGDFSLSFPAKSMSEIVFSLAINPEMLLEGTVITIGVRKDSRLESLVSGMDSLVSLFAPPAKYKGISVIDSPDGRCCYAFVENFLIISAGKSHERIEELIKTKEENIPSLSLLYEERGKNKFTQNVTGLMYLNIEKFLNDKRKDNIFTIKEIWCITDRNENGFKSTVYIPFLLRR